MAHGGYACRTNFSLTSPAFLYYLIFGHRARDLAEGSSPRRGSVPILNRFHIDMGMTAFQMIEKDFRKVRNSPSIITDDKE